MKFIKRAFAGVSLVALMGWMVPALAQEPSSQGSKPAAPAAPAAQAAQAAQESTLKGELVRVDTTAKTISIRTEGATAPMVFSYTDSIKVSGAGDSIAKISSMTGSPVTVTFTKQTPNNLAVRIEVQKKST